MASVAYAADGEVDHDEIEDLVAIVAGRPLTEEETGATIRNLYGTRRFSNVVVDAEPPGGRRGAGHRLLWRAYIVRAIELEGSSGPRGRTCGGSCLWLRAIPSTPPRSKRERLRSSAGSSRTGTSIRRSSPKPSSTPWTSRSPRSTASQAGERARITEPFFDGKTAPFTAADLAKRAKLKLDAGDVYNEVKARDDAERMRKFLLDAGLLPRVGRADRGGADRGRADPPGLPHHRRAPLRDRRGRPQAEGGREADPRLSSSSSRSTRTCSSSGPRTGAPSSSGRATTARRSRPRRAGTDPVLVTLAVEAGSQVRRRVGLDRRRRLGARGHAPRPHGHAAEGAAGRREGAADRLRPRGGRVGDPRVLPAARAGSTPRVKSSVQDGSKPDLLKVAVFIVEGPRAFVRQRQVEGAEHLALEELDSLLTVKVGDPFNPAAVRHDVGALTTRYRNTRLAFGHGPGPLHDLGGPDGRATSITRSRKGSAPSSAGRSSAATPSRASSGSAARSPGRRASRSRRRRSPTRSRTWRGRGSSAPSTSGRSPRTRRTRRARSTSS